MSSSTTSNSISSSTPSTTTTTMVDVYSHDPDCKFEHPIPDSDTLDNIINTVIDSHSSSNSSIARTTREFIENTIHQPLHSLLIPTHKCKSPFAFHQHLSARTLFKLDYINIIHKEILSPKQKLSASPVTPNCINLVNVNTSIRPPGSGRNSNFPYPPSSPSSSTKTLDQEIHILASLWGESSQEVKQVYEVLEKCSKIIHEYMFVANRVEKEREEAMIRIENADIYRSTTNSNLLNKQQRIISTTDSTESTIDGQIKTNYESKGFQKKSD